MHHLIEKRFAKALGIDNADDILSIVITDKTKHQEITSAFRSLIKCDTANSLGTSLATPQEIWKSIVEVYRKYGMDEYLGALKEHILTYAENAGKITDWMGV